ncbi:LysR family transcriptional regulator [Pseudomonas canadensis]|uniref:LysR family transcriptional regulator n=1 Tax=Pseudomonas canadensis TaxID=915099 RepID=A0ABZ1A147_9PSED|nr:LysR family transcriptional regulator [Pseudomonas canadensis]MCF5170613.1 LysR family transcriptional regulator [Pseudomonas canadensis]WRI23069.1 LysR family transcriptional regulator [Pseudomonas canadensis]
MFSSERLKGIDVFVCVADSGSFTAAAEKMSLTASAISKSIARLETRLGARLFLRTTRRLSLTEAGVAFYRTCTGVLADLEEAELSLRAEQSEPRGRVRIDLPNVFGRVRVLPVLLPLLKTFPSLVPHISFSDGLVDPFKEGVDLVVRVGGAQGWPETIEQRVLAHEWHTLCASPDYLANHGTPTCERELERHQCLAYGWVDGRVSPWNFAGEQGTARRWQMSPHLVIGNGDGLMQAALAGCGIVQLPSWVVRPSLEEGKLVEVLPQLATEGAAIRLAWVRNRQALPKVSVVLEALVAGLGGR